MGNSTTYTPAPRPPGSKKHGTLAGNDVPAALDEEERRPAYAGRAFCPVMERQKRHSRLRKWQSHW